MNSQQQLEQLIDDRRAELAHSSARRPRTPRWLAGWTLRRSGGRTSAAAGNDQGAMAVVPRVAGTAGADPSAADWATSLAHLVSEHGLGRNEAAIAHVVRTARQDHRLRLCTDILEDRSLPDVVRERALGRLLTGLANPANATSDSSDRAA